MEDETEDETDRILNETMKPIRERGKEATIEGCSRIVQCACSAPFVQYTSCDNCRKLGRLYCTNCLRAGELVETGNQALGYFLECRNCRTCYRATLEQIELVASCNICGRAYTEPPDECRYCIPRAVLKEDFPCLQNWRWVYEWKAVDPNSVEDDPPAQASDKAEE